MKKPDLQKPIFKLTGKQLQIEPPDYDRADSAHFLEVISSNQPGKRPVLIKKQMLNPETGEPVEITEKHYFVYADCGHYVAPKKIDENIPYIAGKCYKGHEVCNQHWMICSRCHRPICPRELYKFIDDKPVCKAHALYIFVSKIWLAIISLFIKEVSDEDDSSQNTS